VLGGREEDNHLKEKKKKSRHSLKRIATSAAGFERGESFKPQEKEKVTQPLRDQKSGRGRGMPGGLRGERGPNPCRIKIIKPSVYSLRSWKRNSLYSLTKRKEPEFFPLRKEETRVL